MQVREIMTPHVETVTPQASLTEAATRMKDLDVGAIPVQDNGKTVGIITDRDIAIRAVADGRDPNSVKVSDVMTAGVTTCQDNDSVERLREIMESEQIRRVLVVDDSQRLVGIVSLGDLALAAQNDRNEELSGEVLKSVSKPGGPNR